jgi:hypothetical protein
MGDCLNVLANEFKVYSQYIFQTDKLIGLNQNIVIIDDIALGKYFTYVEAQQNQLLFTKTVFAVKALDFKIIRIENNPLDFSNRRTRAQ